MKRTLFFMLLSVWLFSPAAWAYDFYTGGIYYNILSSDNKTVAVRSGDFYYRGDVIIPATVTNEGIEYRVTAIDDLAFYDCNDLTSVTIPESVTAIGKSAFHECSGLTSIAIPNSVTTIGNGAFRLCEGLKSVTIGTGVTTIDDWAFSNCGSLTSVTIGKSVQTIGSGAFYYCKNLTSVIIPESVTTIGESAFSGCRNLTSISIPESVTAIGYGAFSSCRGLEKFEGKFATADHHCLVINDTLRAFAPSGLTQYTIPDEVKVIGESAFSGCRNLTSISIPESVTTIGDEAFYWCRGLTSVTIGESVTTIGNFAFSDCESLTSVTAYNPIPVNIVGTDVYGNFCTFFDGVDCTNCTLYVSAESVELYKADEGWSEFGTILPINETDEPENPIVPENPDTPDTPDVPDALENPDEPASVAETPADAEHIAVYNLQGVLVLEADNAADLKTLQNGAYIVNGKKMIIAR